jgi:hypothetical protein
MSWCVTGVDFTEIYGVATGWMVIQCCHTACVEPLAHARTGATSGSSVEAESASSRARITKLETRSSFKLCSATFLRTTIASIAIQTVGEIAAQCGADADVRIDTVYKVGAF